MRNGSRPNSTLTAPAAPDVFPANVANAEAVQAMMQQVWQRRGGLDFLINNAGIIRDRTIAKMSLD